MLVDGELLEDQCLLRGEVVVVGSGPAGIVVALELANAGIEVVLVESGGLRFTKHAQDLGETPHFNPRIHAPISQCTRRQIGGTSAIWGGRCVPYDPLDFDERPYVTDATWPISYGEIARYFQRTCDWCRCGDAEFDIRNIPGVEQKSIVPGLPEGEVLTSCLERWSLPTNFGKEYRHILKSSKKVKVIYGLTCTEIQCDDSGKRVAGIRAKTLGGREVLLNARAYVLACGGLETTRLLMVSDSKHDGGIGNHSGILGRFYMGHISGRIAKAHFQTPPKRTVYGFDRDPKGVYLRRRFSFTREFHHEKQLQNIVAWLVNPDIHDPSHGSGVLSFAYLMLSSPVLGKYIAPEAIRKALAGGGSDRLVFQHLKNILFDAPKTIAFIPSFGYRRFVAYRKIPGFYIFNKSNIYPLHYHGEQAPNSDSRVFLTEDHDQLGMRKLKIDLRYSSRDIDDVIRAHHYWDEYLRKSACGYLEYTSSDLEASVWEQAADGFHQNGTTRMSGHPDHGVVGKDCNIHGFEDLFVASSSIFVTSGQANSTFTIVAFAVRLADHLKNVIARH
jgi:choline dehydrogenase-like flavoprotein